MVEDRSHTGMEVAAGSDQGVGAEVGGSYRREVRGDHSNGLREPGPGLELALLHRQRFDCQTLT